MFFSCCMFDLESHYEHTALTLFCCANSDLLHLTLKSNLSIQIRFLDDIWFLFTRYTDMLSPYRDKITCEGKV